MDFSKARPRTATGQELKYLPKDEYALNLTSYCNFIFSKANASQTGKLSIYEFLALVQSPTLGLDLTDEQAHKMMSTYESEAGSAEVAEKDFVFVMTDLARLHSARLKDEGEAAWEWFVMFTDDDIDALPLYYNTERRVMTYEKPAGMKYVLPEEDAQQEFEMMTNTTTGEQLTTYIDAFTGVRMCLNIETGEWNEFPDDWYPEYRLETEDGFAGYEEEDAWGEDVPVDDAQVHLLSERPTSFTHPTTGIRYDCIVQNGERQMFDDKTGGWVPIPLAIEVYMPTVADAIRKMSEEVPGWNNPMEQIMALRFHGYSVASCVAWKREEVAFSEEHQLTNLVLDSRPSTTSARGGGGGGGSGGGGGDASQAELDALREELSETKHKLAQVKTDAELQHASAGDTHDVIAKFKVQLQEKDAELAKEKTAKKELSDQLVEKDAGAGVALTAANTKVDQLEQRIKELAAQNEQMSGKGGSLEDSLKESQAALEAARARVAELTTTEAELGAAKVIAEKKAEELGAEAAAAAAKAEKMEARMGQANASKDEQKLGMMTMVNKLKQLKNEQVTMKSLLTTETFPAFVKVIEATKKQLADASVKAIENATQELVARYRFEVRQRKLLYNQLQELKGNIRIFCRVRYDNRVSCILQFPDAAGFGTPTAIKCPNPKDPTQSKQFEFDRVFSPQDDQAAVFDDTEPVMTSCVDGYNVTIMAYGQTGSGKSYTMMGTEDNAGVNRRAVKELIRVCAERETVDYTLHVSMLEIYNERIVDLLTDVPVDEQDCELRMEPGTKAGYVTNLTWRPVVVVEDVVKTLADGESNRSTASTKMNSVSSRSHLLLSLKIEGKDKISGQVSKGKLTMVDLAGSERIAKTEATGQRLVEAAAINKSLSALGQVFAALRTGQQHVPYRNSKLTHLLQDSLGGDAKTCVFINTSPAESNLPETLGTLNFGSAISKIELKKEKKPKKK